MSSYSYPEIFHVTMKNIHSEPTMLYNTYIQVNGWIVSKRKQNDMIFIELNDGTTPKNLQIILHKQTEEQTLQDAIEKYQFKNGEYMVVEGCLQKCPEDVKQEYEFVAKNVIEYGEHKDNAYGINKKTSMEQLRSICHLRSRTRMFGSIFRIRNTIMRETHNFFQDGSKGFLLCDPNMITGNECEGGAGVFTATEIAIPGRTIKDFKKDHFKKQSFLTVSSQLQLEGMCCGLGNVYTTNRSFRSEHSSTSKHLSEFTHLEIEMNNVEMKDVMDIGEKYIKWMIRSVWFNNKEDLDFLSKTPFNKGLLETYKQLQTLQFYRVSYDEIYKKISEMKEEVEYSYMDIPDFCYGDDLSSELEKFIVNLYGGAVFVTNWPKNIKSFYMRIDRKNPELVENFDLLMPFGVGELIGGSMREEQLELLTENMKAKEVSQKGLEWYLDLRKYGTCKHGGFGLGMERLMMMLTGVSNIRDVIPYPNSYETCYY